MALIAGQHKTMTGQGPAFDKLVPPGLFDPPRRRKLPPELARLEEEAAWELIGQGLKAARGRRG